MLILVEWTWNLWSNQSHPENASSTRVSNLPSMSHEPATYRLVSITLSSLTVIPCLSQQCLQVFMAPRKQLPSSPHQHNAWLHINPRWNARLANFLGATWLRNKLWLIGVVIFWLRWIVLGLHDLWSVFGINILYIWVSQRIVQGEVQPEAMITCRAGNHWEGACLHYPQADSSPKADSTEIPNNWCSENALQLLVPIRQGCKLECRHLKSHLGDGGRIYGWVSSLPFCWAWYEKHE